MKMNNRVIDSNCLNTIRLLAALQVLGGHITDHIYHDVSDIIRKANMVFFTEIEICEAICEEKVLENIS